MKKFRDFFLEEHFFEPDEKLGFWEETIFKHAKLDGTKWIVRDGIVPELQWLILSIFVVSTIWILALDKH